jgi:P-type Mg2+ transporter
LQRAQKGEPVKNGRPSSSKNNLRNDEYSKRLIEICALSDEEAISRMESTSQGLNADAVRERRKTFGENIIFRKKKRRALFDLLARFKDPLVIQLLLICIISAVMADYRSASVVLGMIFISVFLSAIQETRSGMAAEKLQALIRSEATVMRDGKESDVAITEIVPGDIVVLAAGSIIPADSRVIASKDFFVSQSTLTGESMPVEKFAGKSGECDEPLQMSNACFQGNNVVSGTARVLVVNTGSRTFLGAISRSVAEGKEATGFDKGIRSFVWLMIRFMVVMVSATFLIVGITKHDWLQALLFGLSVAVGLTPEMLPMIVTVCLSKGAMALSKKQVIVKKLKAIQNLGAINILCTDKTGTLTQDKIVLEKYVDVTDRKSDDVLRYAYMNSFYQTGLRSLLDRAILSHEELDVEKTAKKVDEIPFDFTRKRMSVVIDYEDTNVLICKGAVEDVYDVCDQYQIDDDIYPLIDVVKSDLFEDYEELSSQGYRVLAIAYKEFPKTKEAFSSSDEDNLVLLGYLAFFDPPKDSAARAIRALGERGVEVKILTGDNELVTQKVCKDVGIRIAGIVTGKELAAMNDEERGRAVRNANVFARLAPDEKVQVIELLKDQKNIVGFLGDGINDAPAMRAADVGISVDSAVDIAKESADIILLERSLLVLQDGIMEGRRIFSNILKYIKMGASSNFGNMASVVGGSALLPFIPMAPVQVLLNNLLYDVSQTGIPTDTVDKDFVEKPHKWDIGFISKFMVVMGPVSSLFDYATFFLMLYFFNCILFTHPGTSPELKAYYESLFHTGWFVESLLTQTLIVHIIRTNKIPFFQSRPSAFLFLTTLAIMGIGIFLPYSALAPFLGLVPLPPLYWPWIAGFVLAYCVLAHFAKTIFNRKIGGGS